MTSYTSGPQTARYLILLRLYYAFITPILRPPSDCVFLALGPNSGSIFWLRKEPRNPHACEMALPLSAGHPQDIRGRAQMSG